MTEDQLLRVLAAMKAPGPAGPPGDAGPAGPAGPTGPPGAGGNTQTKGYWLPIGGGSGGESNQSYTNQRGRWIKDGILLHIWGCLQFSHKGIIVGNFQLKNLPLKTATQPIFYGGICTYTSAMTPDFAGITGVTMQCGGIRDSVDIYGFRPGENRRPLTGADLNDTSQFDFSMVYEVDE